ncbi:MAG: M20/M25/M40 family metallo-hydrolase, partial [Pseudohongiellaceae bacterium]
MNPNPLSFFTVLLMLAWCISPATLAQETELPLNPQEISVSAWLETQQEEMIALLEQITNMNSGSLNKAGLQAVAAVFRTELSQLGFQMESLPGGLIEFPHCAGSEPGMDIADHLLARREGDGRRVLLMGHLDTVFPPESQFQSFTRQGDKLYGPGVYDMKGGLVVMLFALKALYQFGLLENQAISILLNTDEEIGSLSSRPYLEQQALVHDYGLVFEGSVNNNMIRQRKGLGQAKLVVNGRASHAGSAHQDGRSAIRELAYKIIEMENLTDYETGVTVNVGIISGGEARNMVAPCAEAYVDLRYPEPQQGVAAEARFREIAATSIGYPQESDEITAEILVNLHR